jgi:MATE family multidrug resistance protein
MAVSFSRYSVLKEWRMLGRLGGPILIAQLAQMANGVIDTLMAGRASANDLAGVAIGNSLWMPVFLFFIGVLNAQQPLISGYLGARRHERILPVAWHGIYFALCASLFGIFGYNQVEPLLRLIGLGGEAAEITRGYLAAFSMGIPAILLIFALRGLTDGLGYTRIIMLFTLLSTLINIPLNYILIFGKLGFPAMGGVGCGWATTVANWVALVTLWVYLHREPAFGRFRLWQNRTRVSSRLVSELLRLGLPIGFTIFVEATMFSAIALLLAPLGSIVVAGHQVALNIVSVLFMVPLSLGLALTLRVSYLVGGRKNLQARLVARSTLLLLAVVSTSFAGFLLLAREFLASLYSAQPEVIAVASQLLLLGALFQIADGIQVASINALRGFKDTRMPMYFVVFAYWGIGIPLGYILTFKAWIVDPLGASGFWIGMIAALTIAAIWLVLRLFKVSAGSEPDV